MHDHHHDHHHDEHHHGTGSDDGPSLAWDYDNVVLTTVGIDIGSSTSHMAVSRLHLERAVEGLSSRFVLRSSEVLSRSPILLTPFLDDATIDAEALATALQGWFDDAGLRPDAIDTGAVILTGLALERANARTVADVLAASGGRFVTASAGHNLEAILAAHGSGAVESSRTRGDVLLHLDVGGGTTKVAVIRDGTIEAQGAIAVGGRLLVHDTDRTVIRLEPSGALLARSAGLAVQVGSSIPEETVRELAVHAADAVVSLLEKQDPHPEVAELLLTPAVCVPPDLNRITVSGGVSRYLGDESAAGPRDDLGRALMSALEQRLANGAWQLRPTPATETIRATVIGASEFVVQVSGNTIDTWDATVLPLKGLPVVRPRVAADETDPQVIAAGIRTALERLDLADGVGPVALSLPLVGPPRHSMLRAWARGILDALPRSTAEVRPVVVVLDLDLALSLGAVIRELEPAARGIVVLDGIELHELDYIDVGEVLLPANVVTVIVTSMAFPTHGPAGGIPIA